MARLGYLLRKFGEPAPGAPHLRVPPPPEVWVRIPSWEWHRSGLEAVRARTIIGAARVARRLEEEPSERRLRSLPGIGVWTAAEVRQRAAGDPDAVSVGDYHLPGLVGWALAGRKVDDAGMLELLEPYAGHRYRVTRLLESSGKHPPRRGPVWPSGTIGPSDRVHVRAAAEPEVVRGPVEAVPAVGAEQGAEDGEGDDDAEHVQHGYFFLGSRWRRSRAGRSVESGSPSLPVAPTV